MVILRIKRTVDVYDTVYDTSSGENSTTARKVADDTPLLRRGAPCIRRIYYCTKEH